MVMEEKCMKRGKYIKNQSEWAFLKASPVPLSWDTHFRELLDPFKQMGISTSTRNPHVHESMRVALESEYVSQYIFLIVPELSSEVFETA